jgi:predicted amidohydrolase YtcJ
MRRLALLLAALVTPALAHAQTRTPADLIVTNARIYTVDVARPRAQALAVKDGRFLFAGSEREVLALRGPATTVVDAGGRTVIPGMVDAHAHLLGLGEALQQVDLTGTRSYDEVVARVAAAARGQPAGKWIVGRGWDQNDWADTRFPTHEALTRALPNNPVYLTRVDGHAGLANAAAMRAAGVTAKTPDPRGGRLERGASNEPTGVFVDNAQGLVERVIPPPAREDTRKALQAAITESHRYGLVGIHDAVSRAARSTSWRRWARRASFPSAST